MSSHINKATVPLISIGNAPRLWRQPVRISCSLSFDKSSSSLTSDKPDSSILAINGGKGMSWFHEMELEVRDYELDQYRVVNNSVYYSYCEYGAHKLVEKIGLHNDLILAVTEASIKYIAPLRKNDKFLLKVRIYDYSTVGFYFEDLIFKLPNLEPILKSKYTVAVLDKNLHPSRISPFMISKFNQFRLREMSWFHEIELEVRDHELDQFGVVKNYVYANYCECGIHMLVKKIGFDDDSKLAVAEASVKYIAPLRKKDKFLLKARIYDYSKVRFYFEYLIFKLPNLEPILNSKNTVVLLDKNMHPSRISQSIISKFNQFCLMEGHVSSS